MRSTCAVLALLACCTHAPELGAKKGPQMYRSGASVTLEATYASGGVPVPDYDLDVSGLVVGSNAQNAAIFVSGSAPFSLEGQAGELYAICFSYIDPTYAAVDAAYLARPHVAIGTIPIADFAILGNEMTNSIIRRVIVAHTVGGVRSYQLIEVTFPPAVPKQLKHARIGFRRPSATIAIVR